MNEHEQYRKDFLKIFAALESWGPNSKEDTTKAFALLKHSPDMMLEIGCGNGNSTIILADLSDAKIIAIDNEQSALDRLEEKIAKSNLEHKVSTQCVSMTEPGFENGMFDVIWAEASMYVMGVRNALIKWKPLLKANGTLVFSDLVWLSKSPSKEAVDFWKNEYPDMRNVDTRISQIDKAGYQVEESFALSEAAWRQYYEPLQKRLDEVAASMSSCQAYKDIQKEINLYKKHPGEFGYQFFIAKKR